MCHSGIESLSLKGVVDFDVDVDVVVDVDVDVVYWVLVFHGAAGETIAVASSDRIRLYFRAILRRLGF